MITPSGKFDLTIEAPEDGFAHIPVGSLFNFVTNNINGTLTFKGNGKVLLDGVSDVTIPITIAKSIISIQTHQTLNSFVSDNSDAEEVKSDSITHTWGVDDYSFYGEFGLPNNQGWSQVGTPELVEDDEKGQVLKFFRNSSSSYTSTTKSITADEIDAYGGYLESTIKIDVANPVARFIFRRSTEGEYVILVDTEENNITINGVVMDGTSGKPDIKMGEWFKAYLKINAVVDGSREVRAYVNGYDLGLVETTSTTSNNEFNINTWNSPTGAEFLVENTKVIILKEDSFKQLTKEQVAGYTNLTAITPVGVFDLTLKMPEESIGVFPLGTTIKLIALNVGGSLTTDGSGQLLLDDNSMLKRDITDEIVITAQQTSTSANIFSTDLADSDTVTRAEFNALLAKVEALETASALVDEINGEVIE